MEKKMTVVQMYDSIIAKVEGILSADEVAFLEQRKEAHAKKNANRGQTATQKENEGIKETILDFMEAGKSYTITEIQKGVGLETNQKTSALVRQLKDSKLVDRKEIKGKAYFIKM